MTNFELNKVTCRIIKSEHIEMIIHSFITKNLILMGLLVSLLGCHSGSAEVIYQNAQYKNMHLDIFKISDFRQLKLFLNEADSSGKCNSIKTSHNITGCIPAQCLSRTII